MYRPVTTLSPREPRPLPPADSFYWDALSFALATQVHRQAELAEAQAQLARAEDWQRHAFTMELDLRAMQADRALSDLRVVLARLEAAAGESLTTG